MQGAGLAGVPATVVDRARVILEALEQGDRQGRSSKTALFDDLPLFSATPTPPYSGPSAAEKLLAETHPDELTPKAALSLIYELTSLLKQRSS